MLFLLELVPALLLGVLLARSWPELAGVLAPPLAPLVLQTAAPTAVSVLLLSEAAEGGAGGAGGVGGAMAQRPAALVLWSTLAALLTVPLWARLLGLTGLSPGGAIG